MKRYENVVNVPYQRNDEDGNDNTLNCWEIFVPWDLRPILGTVLRCQAFTLTCQAAYMYNPAIGRTNHIPTLNAGLGPVTQKIVTSPRCRLLAHSLSCIQKCIIWTSQAHGPWRSWSISRQWQTSSLFPLSILVVHPCSIGFSPKQIWSFPKSWAPTHPSHEQVTWWLGDSTFGWFLPLVKALKMTW